MLNRIANKDFTVGLIGLGYVGLPLALEFVENGIKVGKIGSSTARAGEAGAKVASS